MLRCPKVLFALCMGLLGTLPENAAQARADEPSAITAIDVLLDPDATMIKRAEVANERLRARFPKGFALDETHRTHITCLQRFVRTADLDKVYAAVDKILTEEKPASWKLKAYKYDYMPVGDLGLAGIVIEPTDDLIRLQKKLIDAVAPFTVNTGDRTAFATTTEEPDIGQWLIDYVRDFVPKASGEHFSPHVTIGLAKPDYLDAMLEEKFVAFTFSPIGLSVYQLGEYGTARKQLKRWELKP